jgi:Tfp pilus assembly protein PilF
MKVIGILLSSLVLFGACATKQKPIDVLDAPLDTPSAAMSAMQEGNRLFRAHQYGDAQAQYEAALAVQPTLAEAHYNLARALEQQGNGPSARQHYLEAANLAPGHKIIWDSPPLRRHGEVIEKLPPDPSTSPTMSPLGGFGGGY